MSEKRFVVVNGKKHAIVSETSRYYVCGKTSFRKGNPNIEIVEAAEKKPKQKKATKEVEEILEEIVVPETETEVEKGEE